VGLSVVTVESVEVTLASVVSEVVSLFEALSIVTVVVLTEAVLVSSPVVTVALEVSS
jgi:hypothetical protein